MNHSIMATAFVWIGSISMAASTQQPWVQEPTGFHGIEFGKPLLDSVPVCPQKQITKTFSLPDWAAVTRMCAEVPHYGGTTYRIHNVEKFMSFSAREVDGKVVEVDGGTKGEWINDVAEALVAKFGKPQNQVSETVQSQAGASFPSTTMTWVGKNLQILYSTTSSRVDESMLVVRTTEEAKKSAQDRSADAKKLADSF